MMAESNYSKLSDFLNKGVVPERPASFRESQLFRDWTEIAGSSIAKHTAQLNVQNGILHVSVNSPTWAHELINYQITILEKLHEKGHKNLKEMSIRVKVSKASQFPAPTQTTLPKPKMDPKMHKVFVKLACDAKDPNARNTFLRLAREKPPE